MGTIQYTAFIEITEPEFVQFQYEWLNERILELVNNDVPFAIVKNDIIIGKLFVEPINEIHDEEVKSQMNITRSKYAVLENSVLKINIVFDEIKLEELETVTGPQPLTHLVTAILFHSLIIFNIAQPGIFGYKQGTILKDGKIVDKLGPVHHFLGYAYYRSNELGWPQITKVNFDVIWNWYWKSNSWGISSTKIERALSALSYLFVTDLVTMPHQVIFWSLIGLEALYCKGNSNLLGQLSEKTEVFLGKRTTSKSLFNRMYDYRSRYVHGDLNFPNKFLYEDISDELDKYDSELDLHFSIASAFLIATLQKMAIKNLFELNFSYVILNE